jgi:hypothetical protein
MLLSDERWGDHRAGIMQLQTPEMHSPNEKQVLVPCNQYLPCRPEDIFKWTELLLKSWNENQEDWKKFTQSLSAKVKQTNQNSPEDQRQSVADDIWVQLNRFLEQFLQKQAKVAVNQGLDMKFHGKPQRKKGPRLRFAQRLSAITSLIPQDLPTSSECSRICREDWLRFNARRRMVAPTWTSSGQKSVDVNILSLG